LLQQGQFAEARQSTQRALDLLPDRDPLRQATARQLQQCEQLLALEEKLPALLKGDAQPADAAERLALAQLCRGKQRYAAAARFAAAAFAEQPKLADDPRAQPRYHAARSAALAAARRGKAPDPPDDPERARLRAQARDWLRDELALWARLVEKGTPQRQEVQAALMRWQRDPDLAGVRDEAALANLPEAERCQWQQLWEEV